jgi:hypothetical protein
MMQKLEPETYWVTPTNVRPPSAATNQAIKVPNHYIEIAAPRPERALLDRRFAPGSGCGIGARDRSKHTLINAQNRPDLAAVYDLSRPLTKDAASAGNIRPERPRLSQLRDGFGRWSPTDAFQHAEIQNAQNLNRD